MKSEINRNSDHAHYFRVHSNHIKRFIYLYQEGLALLLSTLYGFHLMVTLSAKRGAADDSITIGRVVVVSVTVIVEIAPRGRRAAANPKTMANM